jgi:O-antigen ligase
LAVSTLLIYTTGFYVPNKFEIDIKLLKALTNYIKLLAIFSYFILGYNLARLKLLSNSVRYFALGSFIMGLIACIYILEPSILPQSLFYRGIRYQGLMNDPNNFAVLQITAIAFFINSNDISGLYKYIGLAIIGLSVLISGSKTGMLTLIILFILKLVESMSTRTYKFKALLIKLTVLILAIFMTTFISTRFESLLQQISNYIPVFSRVSVIFTDFNAAISDGGSVRNKTWNVALEIIKLSPIMGIGLGNYTKISRQMWDYGKLAHSTYLQLAVEWGMPFAMVFFLYVFYLILKVSFKKTVRTEKVIILRDITIVFLISSVALSLNNARLFWLVLGGLISTLKTNSSKE